MEVIMTAKSDKAKASAPTDATAVPETATTPKQSVYSIFPTPEGVEINWGEKGKARKSIFPADNLVVIHFKSGMTLKMDATNFDAAIQRHLMLHGLSAVIGDAFAGAETSQEALELAQKRLDSLCAGEWTSRGGSGTGTVRISILERAIVAAIEEDTGEPITDERLQSIRAKLDADPKAQGYRKQAKANPAVYAHFLRIQQEVAAEKAKKAEAKAKLAKAAVKLAYPDEEGEGKGLDAL